MKRGYKEISAVKMMDFREMLPECGKILGDMVQFRNHTTGGMRVKQDVICSGAVTAETLTQALEIFFRQLRPHRERLFAYYCGEQSVPKGEAVQGRPNNLLRVPFPRYITEVHTGYFLGRSPTISFEKESSGAVYDRLSAAMDLSHLLFDAARDMSICGIGYLLVWLDQSGLRACRVDPLSCFALRSDTAGGELLGCVRLYRQDKALTRGILYLPHQLCSFIWDGHQVTWGAREENLLHALPLIPFSNNQDGSGDFEMVTGLVDAYNLLLSGAMDDMQSVANAFLALYGLLGTTEADIREANRTRILSLSEGGRAEFITKDLNHEALSQLEGNLRRSILQLSMTPDLCDESFSGNASGVALQYKLWGIEQVRSAKERSFTDGMTRLMGALSGGLATLGTPADLTGTPVFYRNLPRNDADLAQTLLSMMPVLSTRTILEHLPWVSDPEEELRRKKQEETTYEGGTAV